MYPQDDRQGLMSTCRMVGGMLLACTLFAIALASSIFLMLVVGLLGLAGLRGNRRELSFRSHARLGTL
jgi:hypothetical protein